MNQLHQIESEMQKVLALTEFDAGQRLRRFQRLNDKVAATASPHWSPARIAGQGRPVRQAVRAAAGVQEVCHRRLHRCGAAVRKFFGAQQPLDRFRHSHR
jgi:hypothetical protein